MNKKFFSIAVIIVVCLTGLAVFLTHRSPAQSPQPSTQLPDNVLPNAPRPPYPPYSSLPLATSADEARDNAFADTLKDTQGNPWIIDKNFSQDHVLSQEKDYSIDYFGRYDSFLISVLSSPFEEKRKEAELRFLQIINAPPEIACKLSVGITTPNHANPDFAGQVFRLSFCK